MHATTDGQTNVIATLNDVKDDSFNCVSMNNKEAIYPIDQTRYRISYLDGTMTTIS